jgi:hypothetical protein
MNRKLILLISLPLMIALIAGSSLVGSIGYRWVQGGYAFADAALLARAIIVVLCVLFAKYGEIELREALRARWHVAEKKLTDPQSLPGGRPHHELN